jgi:acetyl-CoA carboxylase carboxyl transferase subunit alpha
LGIIDEIIDEPSGGAHTDLDATGEALREALVRHLAELRKIKPDKLIRRRAEKFGKIGAYSET